MRPQRSKTVVVAVERPHDDVDMKLRRLCVGREHTRVMIEFDKDRRTLCSVIERIIVAGSTDPAEKSIADMPLLRPRAVFPAGRTER
jgi:hypothetical protein